MLARSCSILLGATLMLTSALSGVADGAMLTGTLSTEPGEDGLLEGIGQSWGSGSSLTWTVDTGYAPGVVSYSYTLSVAEVPAAGISHLNVETSPNFTEDDLLSADWPSGHIQIGFLELNPGSHDMPSGMTGIKFEGSMDGKTMTVNFTSSRMPIWGDFYAKGGDANVLWNAGFGTPAEEADALDEHYDPVAPAASGSIDGLHLLVPDTIENPPLTGTLTVIKFYDENEDGTPDAGEPFMPGWEFSITGPESKDVFTGLDGTVTVDLLAGSYTVDEVTVPDWSCTTLDPQYVTILEAQGATLFFGNVPEPSVTALLVFGVTGLLARRRKAR